jgi:regulator of RNase E activity RraA
VNVPVEFTSAEQSEPLTISPGDLILADLDGVVVVPPDKVDECLAICEERAKIDALTVEALERGEEMGATLARLRK